MKLARNTKKSLKTFALTLAQTSEGLGRTHFGFSFGIPDELLQEASSVGIEPESSLWFDDLEQEAFRAAVSALVSDPALEHLKRGEVDKAVRKFAWQIHISSLKERAGSVRQDLLREFIEELEKPICNYSMMYQIDHLYLPKDGLDVGAVSFRTMTQEIFENWHMDEPHVVMPPKLGDTVAICDVIAGSSSIAHQRARKVVDEALDAIRISVVDFGYRIWDFQLGLRRAPRYFGRREGSSITLWGSFHDKLTPLELNNEVLGEFSAKSLRRIALIWDPKINEKLRSDFTRAVRWIGKSIVAQDFDDKIVSLCTALECILSDRSKGLKSVDICRRAIVLGEQAGEGFIHPSTITLLYEMRSDVIHGSDFEVGTEQDYRTLLNLAVDVLFQAAEVVGANEEVTSKRKLFEFLDDPSRLRPLLKWCKNEDSKTLKDLVADLEDRVEG